MARGTYDNSYNRNRTRIDTRSQSDPAVAAGMRNIHRDTNSTGESLMGSRFRPSRLDAGPQTPGLDRLGADPTAGMSRADRAAHNRQVSQDAEMAGKFGAGIQKKAINMNGRQSLFRDMQKVGAGGITPEMRNQAMSLGIDDKQWSNGMGKLKAAPAAIARPDAPVAGSVPKSLASRPSMPAAAPLQGAEKARADMSRFGAAGAAERFLAANPVKDAQARIAQRGAAKAAATAELDAVDPKFAAQGMKQAAFAQRAGTGASRFRTAMR